MTLAEITHSAIDPALQLLPAVMDSPQARVMLLTMGLQESRFEYRRQMGNGPARGFWQFERGGGVKGCMTHAASKDHLAHLCRVRNIRFDAMTIWQELERDDVLAAGLARLLLWTDPHKLPAVNDVDGAWELYLRTWRPGKPHVRTWAAFHKQAREFVK